MIDVENGGLGQYASSDGEANEDDRGSPSRARDKRGDEEDVDGQYNGMDMQDGMMDEPGNGGASRRQHKAQASQQQRIQILNQPNNMRMGGAQH